MNYLLLILLALCGPGQDIAKKNFCRQGRGVYTFSAGGVLVAFLICLLASLGKPLQFDSKILPYVMVYAVCFAASNVSSVLAISTGSLYLTSLFISYSLLMPTCYGVFFLNEAFTWMQGIGLIFLLLSLYFVSLKKGEEKSRPTLKWWIFAIIAALGNGFCGIAIKMQQMQTPGLYQSEFLILGYGIITIILLVFCGIFDRKNMKGDLLHGGWWILGGLCNVVANILTVNLSGRLPASLMFPVVSAGGILVTVAVSVFIYREVLSKEKKIGLFLGIFSMILLNL